MFPDFGLIPDAVSGLPVGFSRREVKHLASLPSLGINCASCHVGEIQSRGGQRVRVLGATSHFDVETFFGAVIVATFRTADPANMEKFLTHLDIHPSRATIEAALKEPLPAGDLLPITQEELVGDNAPRGMMKLFHNMRFAVHVSDQPPPASPPNGPGRNDPWRILSYSLLGVVTKPAPVKFGIVWNEDQRNWVHVDGNTHSPIVRNLAAALGLGAPLLGHTGVVDFAVVERQTKLSQVIRPPKYPWAIDHAAAERGGKTYRQGCASCHDDPSNNNDVRLYDVDTDPNRAEIFTADIAEKFNCFFAELRISGYQAPEKPLRSTQKYWAPDLAGVWARAPYLHNGSVRTMEQLLSTDRQTQWHRGTCVYDEAAMGYVDDGAYVLDTTAPGNSNRGHECGARLSAAEKHDLIEFLKTK
jgi:hypothetical protein